MDYHYAKSLAMIFDCPNTSSFEAVAPTEEFAGVTFTDLVWASQVGSSLAFSLCFIQFGSVGHRALW